MQLIDDDNIEAQALHRLEMRHLYSTSLTHRWEALNSGYWLQFAVLSPAATWLGDELCLYMCQGLSDRLACGWIWICLPMNCSLARRSRSFQSLIIVSRELTAAVLFPPISSSCFHSSSFTPSSLTINNCPKMAAQSGHFHQPIALPFFLRIESIEYVENPRQPKASNGPDFYEMPPASKEQFIRTSPEDWLVWQPGEANSSYLRPSTPVEDANREIYSCCSIFWSPERHAYQLVPIDCSREDLSSTSYHWRRLSFGQYGDDIAVIGYSMSNYQLHKPGPTHWFEDLLPVVCKPKGMDSGDCKLAGDLSVLIALVAFSAAPAHMYDAVNLSFRPNLRFTTFRSNDLPGWESEYCASPEGQILSFLFLSKSAHTLRIIWLTKTPILGNQIRGMVVTIGYDRRTMDKEFFRRWQSGELGEIFS